MKFFKSFVCFTILIALVACDKSRKVSDPEQSQVEQSEATTESSVEKSGQPEESAAIPQLSPQARAERLGFAKHLPRDTGVLMSFYDVLKNIDSLTANGLGKLLREQPNTPFRLGSEPLSGKGGPSALFEQEITIALGIPVGTQTAHLLKLQRRLGYFDMRSFGRSLGEAAKAGDITNVDRNGGRQGPEKFVEFLKDPESGMALLEQLAMPPLYVAFKTTPENTEQAQQQIAQMVQYVGFLGEMVEPIEVEKNGNPFRGLKIPGVKLAELLEAERVSMEETIEPDMLNRLIAAMKQRDLVVLSGMIGDYVVLFLGSSAEELVFASSIEESMVAGDALAFHDAYADKKMAVLIHGAEEAMKTMNTTVSGISDMALGLRDGLAESDGLGDTRDIEELLRLVAERQNALQQLTKSGATGTLVFVDDGLRIESFGGTDAGAVDWRAPSQLTALGDAENVLFFAQATGNQVYDQRAGALVEAVIETAYAMGTRFSELQSNGDSKPKSPWMTYLLDTKLLSEGVAMWQAISGDVREGLGGEKAVVVDLSGTVPAIPDLPEELANQSGFPRLTLVAPVADRAKLAEAWQKMNLGATAMLTRIGEINDQHMPMQKPMSSDKNGFTTWFFPLPVFNDDFVPSVTVGEKYFAASTSKNQALDLLAKAGSKQAGGGAHVMFNFKALRTFVDSKSGLLEKHGEALKLDSSTLEAMQSLAAATNGMGKLTAHSRMINGVLRTSVLITGR